MKLRFLGGGCDGGFVAYSRAWGGEDGWQEDFGGDIVQIRGLRGERGKRGALWS